MRQIVQTGGNVRVTIDESPEIAARFDSIDEQLAVITALLNGGTPTPTPAPVFTVQPSIAPSTGAVGTTFTGSDGTITNSVSVARQWLLNGTAISGATGATYVSAAVGSLTYRVTATGPGGTTPATSAAATVTSGAPAITTAPSFTGTPGEGLVLTGTQGTYTNSPTSYARQWQRSADGGTTWSAISGATAINYTLVNADVGKIVRLTETATNAGGTSPQNNSSASGTVAAATANTLYGDGDSIVAGGASHFGVLSGVYPVTTFTNAAVGGSTQTGVAPSLTDRQAAMLAADPRVLYTMIGPNDLTNTTKYPDVTDWIADRQAYLTAAKAGGAKNVVGTILPRQNYMGFTDATLHNSRRAAVRTWYISQLGGLVDAIADYDATIMGPDTAPNNATYYDGDKLHPTGAGQDAMKPNCKAAVNAAFGITNVVSAFAFVDQSGVTASTVATSNAIQIGALAYGETRTATVSGGEMRKTPLGGSAGSWGTTAISVTVGDMIEVRGTSNATANGTTNVTLTVDGQSDTFTITTANNLSPLTTTYRSANTAAVNTDPSTHTFSSVPYYAGTNWICYKSTKGSFPTGLTLGGNAGTLVDSVAQGTNRLSWWVVPASSGGSGNLTTTGITGGLANPGYSLYSSDANAAWVSPSAKLINYASSDPGSFPSLTKPAGGSLLCGLLNPNGSVTPETGTTEDSDLLQGGVGYWDGQRATTGQFSMSGIAFSGATGIAIAIQPT